MDGASENTQAVIEAVFDAEGTRKALAQITS